MFSQEKWTIRRGLAAMNQGMGSDGASPSPGTACSRESILIKPEQLLQNLTRTHSSAIMVAVGYLHCVGALLSLTRENDSKREKQENI
jgi:hypothetical protein